MLSAFLFIVGAVITPPQTPTSTNNAFTVLQMAFTTASDGDTLQVQGHFDFREPNAAASWALGADGVAGNGDDYEVTVPEGLDDITLTAATLGDVVFTGPGDLIAVEYEKLLDFRGLGNVRWKISNLTIEGFDVGIFFERASAHAYDNTLIENNEFRIPVDIAGDGSGTDAEHAQNIGLFLADGAHQTVRNNRFVFDGTGVSGAEPSKSVGFQNDVSNTVVYEGLQVTGNTLVVHGTPNDHPARIYGIYENGNDGAANVLFENNRFSSDVPFATKANFQKAFIPTTQSNIGANTQAIWRNNTAVGSKFGVIWLDTYGVIPWFGPDPLLLQGQRCEGVDTCVDIVYGGKAKIDDLRAVGGRVGVLVSDSTASVQDSQLWKQSEASIRLIGTSHLDAGGGAVSTGGNSLQAVKALAIDNQVLVGDAATHTAQHNIWDDPAPAAIEILVHHSVDDPSVGTVDFSNGVASTTIATDVSATKEATVTLPHAPGAGFVTVTEPMFGVLSVDGVYTRTQSATDTFTYRLGNAAGLSLNTASITLTNLAPTISGTPALTATVGSVYFFVPINVDPNGDSLTYSATGLPAWLALDPATGSLFGTPTDAGTTDVITESVTDGDLGGALAPFQIVIAAAPAPPPAPVTPVPVTPAPVTPAPVTPAPLPEMPASMPASMPSTPPDDVAMGDPLPVSTADVVRQVSGSGCRCHASAGPDASLLLFACALALRRLRRAASAR